MIRIPNTGGTVFHYAHRACLGPLTLDGVRYDEVDIRYDLRTTPGEAPALSVVVSRNLDCRDSSGNEVMYMVIDGVVNIPDGMPDRNFGGSASCDRSTVEQYRGRAITQHQRRVFNQALRYFVR
ncbi:hypothetical protein ACFL0V_02280 [Nanoarchaeota archaeon]